MIITSNGLYASLPAQQQPAVSPPGLLNGKAGMAIVNYLAARYTGDEQFREKGLALLNEIADAIDTIQQLDFATGIAGIGWAIEWLAQEQLLTDTNTDEILGDIDDTLYLSVSFGPQCSMSVLTGVAGRLAYFLKRSAGSHTRLNYIRNLYMQDCVCLLADDMAALLTAHINQGFNEEMPAQLGSALYHFSTLKSVNIVTADTVLYNTVAHVDTLLTRCETDAPSADMLYLAACYAATGRTTGHLLWEEKATGHILRLHALMASSGMAATRVDPFQQLTLYTLINLLLPGNTAFENELNRLITLCSSRHLPECITNGRGLVALCELCRAAPGLTGNWFNLLIMRD